MKYNKDRMALLAGIDGRDEYFGKTLRENFSFGGMAEAEDDLDAAEDAGDDTPVDVEGGDEGGDEAPAEDMVSKEDVAGALADVLGVDAGELTALVSDEGGEDEADEGGDEEEAEDEGGDDEGDDLDLDLGEADEKEEADFQSLYCTPLQAINTAKMSSTIAERKKLCDEGFKVVQHNFMST